MFFQKYYFFVVKNSSEFLKLLLFDFLLLDFCGYSPVVFDGRPPQHRVPADSGAPRLSGRGAVQTDAVAPTPTQQVGLRVPVEVTVTAPRGQLLVGTGVETVADHVSSVLVVLLLVLLVLPLFLFVLR